MLRSTIYPGVTALIEKLMARLGRQIEVAFCPERIAEGKAFVELFELRRSCHRTTKMPCGRAAWLFRTPDR